MSASYMEGVWMVSKLSECVKKVHWWCLEDYFLDILQVKGKYLENVKNWVLSVEYLRGKVSGKCMKGNKRVALCQEKFRFCGSIASGA